MRTGALVAAAAGMGLAACATPAARVAPAFISPTIYANSSCEEIGREAQIVSSMLAERTRQQDNEASKDIAATAVSIVIFWPALLALDGRDMSEDLARLKGQMQAIEAANAQKNCGFVFAAPPPPPPPPPPRANAGD